MSLFSFSQDHNQMGRGDRLIGNLTSATTEESKRGSQLQELSEGLRVSRRRDHAWRRPGSAGSNHQQIDQHVHSVLELKDRFFVGRTLTDLEDLNCQLLGWLDAVANRVSTPPPASGRSSA
jgi:hypothetical protein